MHSLFRNLAASRQRLILVIGAALLCFSGDSSQLQAACGDWLEHRNVSSGEMSSNVETYGTLTADAPRNCPCKGLSCRPANDRDPLPDQTLRLVEGEWALLTSLLEKPDILPGYFRLSEKFLGETVISGSIFHPPRSL